MRPQPAVDCALCPRLRSYRDDIALSEPAWHNAPVASFGADDAALLIVGLAPGLSGANRTGRPFTGDFAGDLLYATLAKYGLSDGRYDRRPDDGLSLVDCRITNAVRCVPPQNKPTTPEIRECMPFLAAELTAAPRPRVILALGRIAHDSVLRCLDRKLADHAFGHGAVHQLDDGQQLHDSYHCSRYNTNTGRLTPAMFEAVFDGIAAALAA